MYRLAKVSERRSSDFQIVWCIKSEENRLLTNDEDVK